MLIRFGHLKKFHMYILILLNTMFSLPPSLQMHQWFNAEGERHLLEAESVEDSGDRMEQILNSFTGFLIEANVSLRFLVAVMCLCVSRLSTCQNLSLSASACRTEGTTPWRWCQRRSGSSRAGPPTRRRRRSGPSSPPSSQAWRTSCAGQRRAAGSYRSWSTCVISVSRLVCYYQYSKWVCSQCSYLLTFVRPRLDPKPKQDLKDSVHPIKN